MKCITLTLNPAFDKHCFVKEFKIGYEHLSDAEQSDAGGKGVNISRALKTNGIESNALVVLGKENKAEFCSALDADDMSYTAVEVLGRVRENLTIHTASNTETRISFKGFNAEDSLLDEVYGIIEGELDSETILTFTGSLPVGISMPAVNSFLKKAADKGARVVIDSKSFKTLEEIVALKPWLIKPNEEEISEYLGKEVKTHAEISAVANHLHKSGIENVMVSLGHKGAMLVCSEGSFTCAPPKIEAKSTIGAGDSSIAGFIAATIAGLGATDALKTSVAYGTAACMQQGTQPPLASDVEDIFAQLQCSAL